jgi:S1-C subfamily serine protease
MGDLQYSANGEVLVRDVKLGGSAAIAGVRPGSIIHSVNGQAVLGMDTRQVRDQILGMSYSVLLNASCCRLAFDPMLATPV